jgi:hypothetical protein
MNRIARVLVILLVLICAGGESWAARLGPEFQVNSYTTDLQSGPSVAALSGGGFVVTWTSDGQDGSGYGIYGRRYDALGHVGGAFKVNTYTASDQGEPSVTALRGGGFVVTWSSYGQDGSSYGVYGQRYSLTGARDGIEFPVNTYAVGAQSNVSVASLSGGLIGGEFVVTWNSYGEDFSGYGIYGRRYNALGPVGGAFRVNTYTASDQLVPSVAGLSGGGFVVTWQSYGKDGSSYGIYGQLYSSTAVPIGSEFPVNSRKADLQYRPRVAGLDDGGFVVTWSSFGQDGSLHGVYGQRYNSAGARVGVTEFQVNTYTASSQNYSSVVGLSDGGFVVTWSSIGQDGSGIGVYGQRYSVTGARVGSEFRVNTYTASDQDGPRVAGLGGGGFVVTWHSFGQDGSSYGVYGQRYGTLLSNFPLDGKTSSTADVVSIFDHSMRNAPSGNEVEIVPFKCDGLIQAFSGDRGLKKNGADTAICSEHPGYYKDLAHTQVWSVNGINYVGTEGGKVLNYEGHPGIDYRAPLIPPTPVYSAAAGTIKYPMNTVGAKDLKAYNLFHVLALIPNVDTSYRIYYLHLSTHPSVAPVPFPITPQPGCYRNSAGVAFTPTQLPLPAGTRVNAGCLIALSGQAGTCDSDGLNCHPHLHFEVQRKYPADQVKPTVTDATTHYLWCWPDTGVSAQDPSKICLPLDPYGWETKVTDCSNPDPKLWVGDIYECLSGIQSENLWR